MLYPIIIILHILISVLLIGVVMVQSGRGGGLAGAFGGGGGNETLFGGRGASTFLSKTTWVLGGAFMVTSLILALAIGRRGGPSESRSLLQENPIEVPAPSTAPLNPIGQGETPSGTEATQPTDTQGNTETPGESGGQ